MPASVNIRVLYPTGMLSSTTWQPLQRQFNDCLATGARVIVLELRNVTFIDSSGLGLLVAMYTRLQSIGGKLFLCSPNSQARCLFDITDMNHVFQIFESLEAFNRTESMGDRAISA